VQISIQTDGFDLSEGLRRRVQGRVAQVLSDNSGRISCIRIGLSDINGPRGGVDKRCRVRLVMPGLREVVVDQVELDMYHAIDKALKRVGRAVARRVSRRRTRLLRRGRRTEGAMQSEQLIAGHA